MEHHIPKDPELLRQKESLRLGVEMLGLKLKDMQIRQLESYLGMLLARNSTLNLFSRGDRARVTERHILESMAWIPLFLDRLVSPIMDLGSGAGFPGIPLAICRPDQTVTLVESVQKKARFLFDVCQGLALNAQVLNERVEAIAGKQEQENRYRLIVARAVAPVVQLVKWVVPILGQGGLLLTFKGDKMDEEIRALQRFDTSLLPTIHEYVVPVDLSGAAHLQRRRLLCVKT